MSGPSPPPSSRREVEALADKLAQADFGCGDASALRALEEHLARNPARPELHMSMMALWDELGDVEEPRLAPAAPTERAERPAFPYHKIAAAILPMLIVLGALAVAWRGEMGARPTLDLATLAAERRFVTLSDGSTVSLAPDSAVQVRFDEGGRRIVLAQGEAMFEVAHDPQRPFTVAAGEGEIRAIGTAFNIRMRDRQVIVTVVEGTVSITAGAAREGAGSGVVQLAKAGQQVSYASRPLPGNGGATDSVISPARSVDPARYTGWAGGVLRFNGQPLGEVVEEVNRYSLHQIRIEDPSLARTPIYGVLHVGDYQGLISIVRDMEGLGDAELARKIRVEGPTDEPI